MPKAAVIIAVYNRMDFLRLVFAGLEKQTEQDFEVLIADDGSGSAFVSALKAIAQQSPLCIRHFWHEDAGFRKNRILNEVVRQSKSEYLIFLDGDCIPHPEFVREHLLAAEANTCLAGRRVDLSARLTNLLTPEKIRTGYLQKPATVSAMLGDFLQRKSTFFMYGIYTRHVFLRRFFNRKDRGLLGANFSLHKATLQAINGFDERYTAPTFGEDSDIELRLRLAGTRIKSVLNMAVVYHCNHKLLSRENNSYELYLNAVKEARPFTPYGLLQDPPAAAE